uniref:Uncharacterized protein n=1 Tax=Salix viminalis TaxID=40686 RepID=A0A6N2LG06_SALVM
MKFNKVPTWFPHFNCLCLLSYLNCKKQKRRLIHLPSKQRIVDIYKTLILMLKHLVCMACGKLGVQGNIL